MSETPVEIRDTLVETEESLEKAEETVDEIIDSLVKETKDSEIDISDLFSELQCMNITDPFTVVSMKDSLIGSLKHHLEKKDMLEKRLQEYDNPRTPEPNDLEAPQHNDPAISDFVREKLSRYEQYILSNKIELSIITLLCDFIQKHKIVEMFIENYRNNADKVFNSSIDDEEETQTIVSNREFSCFVKDFSCYD